MIRPYFSVDLEPHRHTWLGQRGNDMSIMGSVVESSAMYNPTSPSRNGAIAGSLTPRWIIEVWSVDGPCQTGLDEGILLRITHLSATFLSYTHEL